MLTSLHLFIPPRRLQRRPHDAACGCCSRPSLFLRYMYSLCSQLRTLLMQFSIKCFPDQAHRPEVPLRHCLNVDASPSTRSATSARPSTHPMCIIRPSYTRRVAPRWRWRPRWLVVTLVAVHQAQAPVGRASLPPSRFAGHGGGRESPGRQERAAGYTVQAPVGRHPFTLGEQGAPDRTCLPHSNFS